VVDWTKTLGNPQATLSQYGNLQGLRNLPKSQFSAVATTKPGPGPNGDDTVTTATVTNTSTTPAVGFSCAPTCAWDVRWRDRPR